MKKQIETLTEQESAFAAENHSLIFRFLSRKGLPEDEYYDDAEIYKGIMKDSAPVANYTNELMVPEKGRHTVA